MTLRALTIMEPWCSAIAFGRKTPENRSWPTSYRGLVALHAGLSIDRDAPDMAWRAAALTFLRNAPRKEWRANANLGAVLAVADLTGCHYAIQAEGCSFADSLCSPWAVLHSWHWEFAGVRPLAEPVPCKGMLGLWRLPEEAEKAVRAQLGEAGRGQ